LSKRRRLYRLAAAAVMAVVLSGCWEPQDNGPLDGGADAGVDSGVDAGAGGGLDGGGGPPILVPNETGWWRDDVFYEVFVRSFYDSDGDGVGDLRGLAAKLDYLNDGKPQTEQDLGVDALWLMPIHPSPSYHGYDVTDYRDVNPDYGTLSDFDAFITAAHARGVKVIIDMVLNHTSSQHPWFVSAREGPGSPYRDYYIWRDSVPTETGWKQPWGSGPVWHPANGSYYYGIYWSGMPDLNWRNPAVEAEFLSIMRFWLARGVDGFRVDAIRYLVETEGPPVKLSDQPETHDIIQRLRYAIHQEYPEALFVAEAWTSNGTVAKYYGEGNEFQLAFSFDIADSIRAALKGGSGSGLTQTNYFADTYFVDRGFEAPFLTNHDQRRVMREVGGTSSTPAWQPARLAAATLLAHPGTPFLYYGEEIGMVGGSLARDEDKRTPMRWESTGPHYGFTINPSTWYSASTGTSTSEPAGVDVASQQADPASLWHLYRALIALRHDSKALAIGTASRPQVEGGGAGVFALLRTAATGERVLFVSNFATAPTGSFTVAASGSPAVLLGEGLVSVPTSQGGVLSFEGLAARSFAFIRID
jgi:alpha-amylase